MLLQEADGRHGMSPEGTVPQRVGTEFPAPGMAPTERLERWWHGWEQGVPWALALPCGSSPRTAPMGE